MIMSNLELKEIRNKMKLSQTEFARLFEKTSMRTVQNWEGGVTPVPEYAKLVIEKELNKGLKSIVDKRF
jgi:DNA-binding transcriptional regulator YiaG